MKENKISKSKIVFWLLFVVFFWIAITYFAKTEQIIQVLSQGKWYWIIPAILCQIFYYPYHSYFASSVFDIFCEKKIPAKDILPIYIASKFTDVALPVATFGEVAIFIRQSKKLKASPLDLGIGTIFSLLFEVTAFLILSFLIIFILFVFRQPNPVFFLTLLFLTAFMCLVYLFIIRITTHKNLNRLFLWLIRLVSRVTGQKKTEMNQIEVIFHEIGKDLTKNGHEIWPALQKAIVTHSINIITFAFIFMAFAGHFNLFAILAGYVACLLFTIVSITPQGVGVAEVIMIKTLQSFGLDLSTGAVITLAFRGLLYWLPLFAGFYVFSHLEFRKEE